MRYVTSNSDLLSLKQRSPYREAYKGKKYNKEYLAEASIRYKSELKHI